MTSEFIHYLLVHVTYADLANNYFHINSIHIYLQVMYHVLMGSWQLRGHSETGV
jgi:hypothetical protein